MTLLGTAIKEVVSIYFDEDWSISPPTKEIKMAYDNFAIVVPERNLV